MLLNHIAKAKGKGKNILSRKQEGNKIEKKEVNRIKRDYFPQLYSVCL